MGISMPRTKLVVSDLETAERFYVGLGLKVVRRIADTSEDSLGEHKSKTRQRIVWVSETGDETSHVIALSRFLDHPRLPEICYPGRAWLVFNVSDVDEVIEAVRASGGGVFSADVPDCSSRTALVSDPDGRPIELIGPTMEH